jgi:hypothetical protein
MYGTRAGVMSSELTEKMDRSALTSLLPDGGNERPT